MTSTRLAVLDLPEANAMRAPGEATGMMALEIAMDEMAEKLVKILEDKKLQELFSKESLKIAQKHDLEFTLKEFEALYNRTIMYKKQEVAGRPATWRDRILESDLFDYLREARDIEDSELKDYSDEDLKKL